uniref:Peptidase_M3 domain-containing protein n=1 Tax=Rhabditophanes sp. KR3021 TaxID=114890 RepID=A0AC35UGZ6_9BILA
MDTSTHVPANCFKIHPLGILVISDHLNRTIWNKKNKQIDVFGLLIGTKVGDTYEAFNTIEIGSMDLVKEPGPHIDAAYASQRMENYKEMFPGYECIGCYTTGNGNSLNGFDNQLMNTFSGFKNLGFLLKYHLKDCSGVDPEQKAYDIYSFDRSTQKLELNEGISTVTGPAKAVIDEMVKIPVKGNVNIIDQRKRLIHTQNYGIVKINEMLTNIATYIAKPHQNTPEHNAIIKEIIHLVHLQNNVRAKKEGEARQNLIKDSEVEMLFHKTLEVIQLNQKLNNETLPDLFSSFLESVEQLKVRQLALKMNRLLFPFRRVLSTGLFGVPELTVPTGFEIISKKAIQNSNKILSEIFEQNNNEVRPKVALFDDISNEICKVADLAECTRLIHSDPKFSSVAESTIVQFTEIVETFNTDFKLYNALKESLENDKDRLDEIDKRTLSMFLADFEQSGIHLNDDKKSTFIQLSSDIFLAGMTFNSNLEQSLPLSMTERLKYGMSEVNNPCSFNADQNTRKFVYNKYHQYRGEQEKNLQTLLQKRNELAQLTGFKSYAERAQQGSILKKYDNVKKFLKELIVTLKPNAEKDLELMNNLLRSDNITNKNVGEWDIHYAMNKYKSNKYGKLKKMCPEIPICNAIKAFESITSKIYGITFEIDTPKKGEAWAKNVIKLNVKDGSNFYGTIYIDAEARQSKMIGDCHYTIRCGKQLVSGEYQTPIIALSFSYHYGNISSINDITLSIQQIENFFHEMGHAMHSMLGRTRYQHTAGTRCPTDMAEIPSNVMEYFFNDHRILKLLYNEMSGNFFSKSEIDILAESRKAFSAFDLMQQSVYSLFDLEIHSTLACDIVKGNINSRDIMNEIWKESLPGLVRDGSTAWQHRFSHLIPYGAKYYSYLIAKASASLIWNSSFVNDPFSRDYGKRWAKIQSHGGQYPSDKLLEMYLGYSPSSIQLADAIQNDL